MFRTNRGPKTEPAKDERQPFGNQAAEPASATTASQPVVRQPTPAAAHSAPQPAAPPQPEKPAPPRALTESDALARDIKDGVVGGFVGQNADLTGEANFKGMLRIDGRFRGNVNSADGVLIVSAGGVVEADIDVATARINGTVNGDIKASQRIEFGRTARVRGDIRTPSLVIEQGAIFEGNCRMTESVAAKDSAEKARVERPSKGPELPLPRGEGAEKAAAGARQAAG